MDNFKKKKKKKKKKKRHVIEIDQCCICKKDRESADHLLLHCEVACALWKAIFNRGGLSWVMPRCVVDLLACWNGLFGSTQSTGVWKIVSSRLLGCL
jgi:hypothetical protein